MRSMRGYALVTLLLTILSAWTGTQEAAAKGTYWDITFESGADNTGTVGIEIDAKRDNGDVDEYLFNINVEETPVDCYWKADNLYQQIDDSPHFQVDMDECTVRVEINDGSTTYVDIAEVSVSENGTGEGIHIVEDDPVFGINLTRVTLNVTGLGTGGWFRLGIAESGYPLAEVAQTAGMTGEDVELALVAAFNAVNTEFAAQFVDTLIVIEDVPCPYGMAFGTTDPDLWYAFRMAVVVWAGAGDPPPAMASRVLRCVPNPFNPQTVIHYELAADGFAELAVYDAGGRRVRTLLSGHCAAGPHEAVWDGRDQRGQAAPSGTYLCRLASDAGRSAFKMSLVR